MYVRQFLFQFFFVFFGVCVEGNRITIYQYKIQHIFMCLQQVDRDMCTVCNGVFMYESFSVEYESVLGSFTVAGAIILHKIYFSVVYVRKGIFYLYDFISCIYLSQRAFYFSESHIQNTMFVFVYDMLYTLCYILLL